MRASERASYPVRVAICNVTGFFIAISVVCVHALNLNKRANNVCDAFCCATPKSNLTK